MVWWQGLLCLAVVAASAAASLGVIIRKSPQPAASPLAGNPLLPPRVGGAAALWMSCWSAVRPVWLLAFRATATVALAAVLLWDVLTYDPSIMVYYTEWTLLLEIAYFAVATACSGHGCLTHSRARADHHRRESHGSRMLCRSRADEPVDGDAGRMGGFMQILYQISAGAVVLTDVVFWGLIVPFMSSAHFSLNAVMGCIHSLNLVFLLTETALNTLAFPWFRIAYFILWTCLYVIVQWIAHACGMTWWPYPFLSPAASWAPVWYFAMALLHFPCYLVYWLIARAKNYIVAGSECRL